jgi:uncharacterized membrane protein
MSGSSASRSGPPRRTAPIQWLRTRLLAGIVVTVPLFVSVAALVWMFTVVDRVTAPFYSRILGRAVPGLGVLSTAVALVLVGMVATNVIGSRVVQRVQAYLLRIPVFRTIYAPVKELAAALSPEKDQGFKQVVLVESPRTGLALGFLTREFVLDRGRGPEAFIAAYVPSNHLYLGDVVVCPRDAAMFPALTVDEGISIALTGGMGLPDRVGPLKPADGPSQEIGS